MRILGGKFASLATERLVLRAPDERDIPAWFNRATDSESASLAGDPVPERVEAGAEWLARSRQRLAEGKAFQWSIDFCGVAEGIGTVSLTFSARSDAAALGFVLGRSYFGRGLATEAAREVLRYAFGELALREVRAETVKHNRASRRVLEKLGFEYINSFVDISDGETCARFRRAAPESPP